MRGTGAVLVLGAGGAARAILYGLIAAGVPKILLANRTGDAGRAPRGAVRAAGRGDRLERAEQQHSPRCSLLVNTTSLGMTGQAPLDIDLGALSADAVVADHRL